MDFDRDRDARIRDAAFDWLSRQVSIHGDVLPRAILAQGFEYGGRLIPLVSPQGIFKPAVMELPLSITTSPKGPYHDVMHSDYLLQYSYRYTGPEHRDNVGLRLAMDHRVPLVYFHAVIPGRYLAMWPVYVVGDRREARTFDISIEDDVDARFFSEPQYATAAVAEIRREYVTSLSRTRLHQRAFRERVLLAYQHQCALCRLRHSELLDAAHIIPDREPGGEPVVSNGIALCRLHHAAFDRFFLAVRPDHIIEVRPDVLEEIDGPTLQYAIQGLHGQAMVLPKKLAERPAVELLSDRYDRFREVVAAR